MFKFGVVLKKLKTYALFISMLVGVLLHPLFAPVAWVTKYMLFCMLLITYCKVTPSTLRFERLHLWLGSLQLLGCLLVYAALVMFDEQLAQGSMICVLAPTATSAPVITGLLGGCVSSLVTYSITSNLAVAVVAPVFLSVIGAHGVAENLSFLEAFFIICKKVMPLLVGPFLLALALSRFLPKFYETIKAKQSMSFWLWVVALALLMGRTTDDLLNMEADDMFRVALVALGALSVCVLQFWLGRRVGRRFDNVVAGGQALGQKNTILVIWMAQTFFDPIVAVAPASYVLWQNLINSYQMWRFQRRQLQG